MRAVVALLLACAGLLLAACAGPAARAPAPQRGEGRAVPLRVPTSTHRLANGLEVILHEDHTVPLVAVSLWYHVGSKDEAKGKAGLAHLVEHVMFTGSAHVPEHEHSERLVRAGGRGINASTYHDRTSYYETVPSNALELALWLEADRMAFFGANLTAATLDRERSVVRSESRQRFENPPFGMVGPIVRAAAFPEGHPYHFGGGVGDLEALTLDDVRAFQRTYYAPSNATLVLAGDFSARAAIEAITRTLGAVPPRAQPSLVEEPTRGTLAGEKRLVIEADVERPRVVLAWPVMPRYAPGWAALGMAVDPLASALRHALVKEDRVGEAVSVHIDGGQVASLFTITATLKRGASLEAGLHTLDGMLDRVRARSSRFDRVQFGLRQEGLVVRQLSALEDLAARADALNAFNHYAGTADYAGRELLAMQDVEVEDVREALYQFLPFDARVVAFVRPSENAPRAGRLVEGRK